MTRKKNHSPWPPAARYVILMLLMLLAGQPMTHADSPPDSLFRGTYYDAEQRIRLVINLYEERVEVPGYSFIGPTHGYMNGNIYGIWIVTTCKLNADGTATVKLSNDQGADSQTIQLTPTPPGACLHYEAQGGNEVKRVQGRKLVKIPGKLNFKRQE